MKILISGVCGFAGRQIAETLGALSPDWEIAGIDNLCRSGSETNRRSLRDLGVNFVHGDLRCRSDLESLEAADWVIDCAALPSVLAGTSGHGSSQQLVEHNLIGTVNLLEYCRRFGAGLTLLSTSRVYSIESLASLPMVLERQSNAAACFQIDPGKPLPPGVSTAGIDETFSTAAPVSLYGATKLASETLAREYALTYDFPLRINRCGVLAGAGQFGRADQGIFSFWVHSHAARKPLKFIGFEGAGWQVRDCLHPRDLAVLVHRQILAGDDSQKPVLANVSGGIESARSLAQLHAWCDQRFGSHPVEKTEETRPFDLPWIVLDSTLAKTVWQWEPTVTTEMNLDEIAEHAQTNPEWLELSQ